MQIILQNKRTRDYVERSGGWTTQRSQARLFGTGMEAMFFCLSHRMHDMQIVGEFADKRIDFTLAVTDARMA